MPGLVEQYDILDGSHAVGFLQFIRACSKQAVAGPSKNKSHFVRSFVNKDRSDDLRKCSVLAVDRNRFCGPVLRANVSLRSLSLVCVIGTP